MRRWTRNATRRSRPTSAATAPRATRGRSTSTRASRDVLALAPAGSRCAATRWAGGSRCTSRSPRPSGSSAWCWSAPAAGIDDAAERAQRRAADERAAPTIEGARRSRSSPSAGRAAAVRRARRREAAAASRADRAAQRPARAGRGAARRSAPGAMAPLWDRLGELTMPVTLLVGERDAKFRRSASRHGRRRCRTPQLVVVPRRRPRRAARGARPRSRDPQRYAGRSSRASDAEARAGAARRSRPRSTGSTAARRPRTAPSVPARTAAVGLSAAAACSGGGDPQRAVERRGEVDLGARRAHERRARRAAARSRRSARSSGRPRRRRARSARRRAPRVSSIATRDRDALAHARALGARRAPAPRRARGPAGASASIAATACRRPRRRWRPGAAPSAARRPRAPRRRARRRRRRRP